MVIQVVSGVIFTFIFFWIITFISREKDEKANFVTTALMVTVNWIYALLSPVPIHTSIMMMLMLQGVAIGAGVVIAKLMTNRNQAIPWFPILRITLIVTTIIAILFWWSAISTEKQINRQESVATQKPLSVPEIQVLVSSQDAEGVTQKDLSPEFLKFIENYTVERVKANANKFRASKGLHSIDFDIQSQSIYVEVGHLKLMVIRLYSPSEGLSQAFVSGIVGSELRRVMCMWQSPETVPISFGPCATKIQEVLGVKIET